MTSSVRQIALAFGERHWKVTNDWGDWCCRCLLPWPCDDSRAADAILAALDAAARSRRMPSHRLLPDPLPVPGGVPTAEQETDPLGDPASTHTEQQEAL